MAEYFLKDEIKGVLNDVFKNAIIIACLNAIINDLFKNDLGSIYSSFQRRMMQSQRVGRVTKFHFGKNIGLGEQLFNLNTLLFIHSWKGCLCCWFMDLQQWHMGPLSEDILMNLKLLNRPHFLLFWSLFPHCTRRHMVLYYRKDGLFSIKSHSKELASSGVKLASITAYGGGLSKIYIYIYKIIVEAYLFKTSLCLYISLICCPLRMNELDRFTYLVAALQSFGISSRHLLDGIWLNKVTFTHFISLVLMGHSSKEEKSTIWLNFIPAFFWNLCWSKMNVFWVVKYFKVYQISSLFCIYAYVHITHCKCLF